MSDLESKIKDFFAKEIRPFVQQDGGDIYLVKIVDGKDGKVVRVSLEGACVGCPLSGITLFLGVETKLKERFSEIERVEVV